MADKTSTAVATTDYKSGLQKVSETYIGSVVASLKTNGVVLDDFQKQCMTSALIKIDEIIKAQAWKSDAKVKDIKDVTPSSITSALTQVATFRLSATAIPSECYITLKGTEIQFAPQGEGYRRLVETYGRGVKRVFEPWIVRENDEFTMPHYKGIEVVPPEWTPTGTGKAVRVVYPIEMDDGSVQYAMATREETKDNLMAHISNNLIGKNDKDLKEELLAKCEEMSVDEILADNGICLSGKVSPAWRHQNKEKMIIRKMKNNALKNISKDFHSATLTTAYEQAEEAEDYEEPNQVVIEAHPVEKMKEEVDKEAGSVKLADKLPPMPEKKKAEKKPEEDDGLPF